MRLNIQRRRKNPEWQPREMGYPQESGEENYSSLMDSPSTFYRRFLIKKGEEQQMLAWMTPSFEKDPGFDVYNFVATEDYPHIDLTNAYLSQIVGKIEVPRHPCVRCTGITFRPVSGVEAEVTAGDAHTADKLRAKYIVATCEYEMVGWDKDTLVEDEYEAAEWSRWRQCISEEFTASHEFRGVPKEDIYWDPTGEEPVDLEKISLGYIIADTAWNYTIRGATRGLWQAAQRDVGKVNEEIVWSPTMKRHFAAEKVLLAGVDYAENADYLGRTRYDITLKFVIKGQLNLAIQGWNKFPGRYEDLSIWNWIHEHGTPEDPADRIKLYTPTDFNEWFIDDLYELDPVTGVQVGG